MEAWQIVHAGLFQDGTVNDVSLLLRYLLFLPPQLLYGLPLGANKLADLSTLAEAVRPHGGEIRILIDHPDQVKILEQFETTQIHPRKWSVYILLDGATKRAGVEQGSDAFNELLSLVFESPHITLYGFYVHASIAYGSTSMDDATSFLSGEVLAVNTAARLALDFLAAAGKSAPGQPFILSVGSTPTAHAMSSEETRVKLANILHGTLELHAGNYPLLDLQQEHTKLISQPQISQRIRVTVLSVYPGRGEKGEDEGLVDGGAIAFSKDTGPSGIFGKVVGRNWELTRISQEHGTITHVVGTPKDTLKLGEVVEVIGQHACLIAAAHLWYYVVDKNVEDGKRVVDVWVAWKGW